MKWTFLTAAACCALWVTPASATDDARADFDWSGAYIGVNAGYGRGQSTLDYDDSGYFAALDPDGWFGGVYGGFNHQSSNGVVFGIEADFQISGVGSSDVLGYYGGVDTFRRFFSDQTWSGALRARLGYAAGRFLPYVTGGLAVARYEHGETEHPVTAFSAADTYAGWTVGAGLEFAATEDVAIRLEYRHSDFGSRRFEDTAAYPHAVDLSTDDFRIGVSFRL